MRAVVIERFGGPEVLQLREWPDPVAGPGEVLVKVGAAGVNFRDVYERRGTNRPDPPPFPAGGEAAGTVVALGDGVSTVAVGDRVAWTHARGSYAELVAVAAERAVPVPDAVSDELAATILLQGITAHYLANTTYPVQPGDWVVVHAAAGGTGRLLTQIVKRRGGKVLATVSSEEKAELARSAGADEVVVGYTGFAQRALDLTGGEGVPAVYDGVGAATFEEGLTALRRRGLIASFGWSSGPTPPLDIARLLGRSLWVTRPSSGDHTATRAELLMRANELFAWAADGSIDVLVGGRYPFAEAARAHGDLESRRSVGKLVLLPH